MRAFLPASATKQVSRSKALPWNALSSRLCLANHREWACGLPLPRRDPKTAGGACKTLGYQAELGNQLVTINESLSEEKRKTEHKTWQERD
jgi:hypothetical protein